MRFIVGPLFMFVFGLVALPSASLAIIDMNRYHQTYEVDDILQTYAQRSPELVRYTLLGTSTQGRPIGFAEVSLPSSYPKKQFFFNGTHHGDEKASTEAILGLLKYLVENAQSPEVRNVLEHSSIVLMPMVNPDGHFVNSRLNAEGFDLNRDYDSPGKTDPFLSKESGLIRDLLRMRSFDAAIAYHSGMEGVLWPWGFTNKPNAQEGLFQSLSRTVADSMGFTFFAQSYNSYHTLGEFIDYAYLQFGTLALTVEVANERAPKASDLGRIVERSVEGALSFIKVALLPETRSIATIKGRMSNQEAFELTSNVPSSRTIPRKLTN
ncbi:MAG: M14 family zinc carboxypeptidase [Oligoflexales bacterium]